MEPGAERGYNPVRPGRHTHHPLLAVLAEAPLVLHGWLRSGKAGSACGVVPFLQEAFALLPDGWKLRTVRADSGFFEQALLGFLEAHSVPYIIVARMTRTLKAAAAAIQQWTPADEHYGDEKHKPLIDKLLDWRKRTSPKLPSDTEPNPADNLKNAV